MVEDALEVATDPDYRFELAIQLGSLDIAKVSSPIVIYTITVAYCSNIQATICRK